MGSPRLVLAVYDLNGFKNGIIDGFVLAELLGGVAQPLRVLLGGLPHVSHKALALGELVLRQSLVVFKCNEQGILCGNALVLIHEILDGSEHCPIHAIKEVLLLQEWNGLLAEFAVVKQPRQYCLLGLAHLVQVPHQV